MRNRFRMICAGGALFTILSFGVLTTPAMAHHSFAMYDQTKTVTLTGVLTRFVAQANHAEIHFVPLGPDGKPLRSSDGKPITWGVEMAGAAAVATQGITVEQLPGRHDLQRAGSIRSGTAATSARESEPSPSAPKARCRRQVNTATPSKAASSLAAPRSNHGRHPTGRADRLGRACS